MVAYNKFQQATKNMVDAITDFDSHAFKVMLSNVAPVNTNQVKADLTEIAAGSGYSAGGTATTITTATAAGVAKATATDVVFTAAGGSIGPFRYAITYDDTPTSPADPLVCWHDYGSAITLADGESFTVDFDGTNGLFTVT